MDSTLINGVAFKKTFSYAGFEQQPKSFVKPKILLLNLELELKSEKDNAEIRIADPSKFQAIVDAEWSIHLQLLVCSRDVRTIMIIDQHKMKSQTLWL